ncbi:MAG: alpha/beta hydrolase [Gammaproteobacteria bacterium]|nr:alpha/beta hydrolase [Gammaproteobacteria bacterium]
MPCIDPAVEVIKDVPFGHHQQTLDIYRPRDPGDNRPVLMQIHGGAWTEKMGSKDRQALPLMAHMARRGWISVSVDYRLSPRATWPEHLIDCKEGLKWIKDTIAEYGGDPGFVIVTGGSAGGQLAAMMALTAGDREYQPGFEDFDATVQGAVPFYGLMDFDAHFARYKNTDMDFAEATIFKKKREEDPEAFRRASPVHRGHADAPPFFVIHGNKDSLVPVEQAREFVHKLSSVSTAPVVYAEIDGAQHAFDIFPSVRSEHVKHGVERFCAWMESNHRPTP